MNQTALIIVDAQRGFMPAHEGQKLQAEGFGELPVNGGEQIVPAINALTEACLETSTPVVTTQDWHPKETAHFATEPNYINTWPVHCVADTPGAQLHPELIAATKQTGIEAFKKGAEQARTPQEDTSYTGYLAKNEAGQTLPEVLKKHRVSTLYVVGLALGDGNEHPLCVDSTALDFAKRGYDVTVLTDAVEAVLPENRALCFKNLGKAGVRLATTAEALEEIRRLQA